MIHQLILQPSEFQLIDSPIGKPSAKLGASIDLIIKYRKEGLPIIAAIEKGCNEVDYYKNSPQRMKKLFTIDNLKYYLKAKQYSENIVIPSDKSYPIIKGCIDSLITNPIIKKQLHPIDVFGDPLPIFPEDTIFQDFAITYKDKCYILHFRGKIDHWSIDVDNKILVLNDVKTSSDLLNDYWISSQGHFSNFCYQMQFAIYLTALKNLCKKEYNFDDTWKIRCHCWAVQTRGNAYSRCYTVTEQMLQEGKQIYEDCMKMVAYYELFGHEEEVKFE